jgi:hypothetical protein
LAEQLMRYFEHTTVGLARDIRAPARVAIMDLAAVVCC